MNIPIVWSPLISVPLLVTLAVPAVVIGLFGLFRRARGAVLRLCGFAFLLLVLAGPRWRVQTTTKLPDTVLVIRDHSPSMAIGDRRKLADQAFRHLDASLPGRTDLKVVNVTGDGHDGTPLFTAMAHAVSTIPQDRLAGIVVISDGEATDKPSPLPPKVPVSTLIPAAGNQTDRALTLLAAPRYGLVGHHVTLRFMVRDHGVGDAGGMVPVKISIDGAMARSMQAPVGQPVSVRLKVAHAGRSVVAVAAAPLPGEVSVANDQAVFDLTGVRRRLTVLLIAGGPNPGLRSWRLLLKSDPAVRLVNFTILRLPTEPLAAPLRDMALIPFPVDQLFSRDLGKFDLIILDQFANDDLLLPPYLANITTHVRNGGALLIEAGPEFEGPESLANSPLEPVLPVLPDNAGTVTGTFTPALTVDGTRDPVTAPLAQAAIGPWYRYEAAQKTRGVSLLRVPDHGHAPLLVLSHEGKGRVAMLMSDQFWLWARGALAQDKTMAGPAVPLLRRTVHWLLGEPSLAATRLTARIAGGTLEIERRSLHGGAPGAARITDPSGKTTSLAFSRTAPGRYVAHQPARGAGVWRVQAAGMTAYAGVADDDPAEQNDLAASDRIMAPIARHSGGRIVWLGKTPDPGWAGLLRPRYAALVTGARDMTILPAIPAAIAALLLLAGAWWRERR